jgi:splicing factor 1
MILSALGGVIGHRKYDCPQIRSFNAGIICHRCRQAGHFQRDCKVNLSAQASDYGGGGGSSGLARAGELDKEYQEFIAEIGAGGGGRGYGQSTGRLESGGPNPWQHPQRVASVAPWVHFPPRPSPLHSYHFHLTSLFKAR